MAGNELASNIVIMNNVSISCDTILFGKHIINFEKTITYQLNNVNGIYGFCNFGSTNSYGVGVNLGNFESNIFANDNHCIGVSFRIYKFIFDISTNGKDISISVGSSVDNISEVTTVNFINAAFFVGALCYARPYCNNCKLVNINVIGGNFDIYNICKFDLFLD